MRQAAVLVVLLAACGGGGGGGEVSRIEQIVLMGSVPAGVTMVDVGVANPLDVPATVDKLGVPAGGFVPLATALPATVPAGGVLTLPVRFSPPGPGLREGEIRLRFVAGSEVREVAVLFRANVEKASLTVLTPTLAFPDTVLGRNSTVSAHVRNDSVLTIVEVRAVNGLPADFSTSFTPTMLAPSEILSIPVTYAPTERRSHDFSFSVANDVASATQVQVTARTKTFPDEEIIDFGSVPVVDGKTDWLEVDVSPDAVSLSIEALGIVGVLDFEGPGGVVYVDEGDGPFLWFPGLSADVLSVTLPQNDRPDAQLVPGGGIYRFRLNNLFPALPIATLPVRAIIHNRIDAVVGAGVLDLNVFLSPGLSITNPATDTKLQAVITRVGNIFAQVGLRVGAVSYYSLTDSTYDELEYGYQQALFQESKIATDTRLNVFFVMTVQVGNGAIGGSAAIAGVKRNGTRGSGVVVDYDFDVAAAVGQVTAHEIGHYLGLWHTPQDEIDDTLVCPLTGTDSVCLTEGGDYVMHSYYFGTALPIVTPGQGNIILRHPLVYPDPPTGLAALAQQAAPEVELVQLPPDFCAHCSEAE